MWRDENENNGSTYIGHPNRAHCTASCYARDRKNFSSRLVWCQRKRKSDAYSLLLRSESDYGRRFKWTGISLFHFVIFSLHNNSLLLKINEKHVGEYWMLSSVIIQFGNVNPFRNIEHKIHFQKYQFRYGSISISSFTSVKYCATDSA